ncbi:SusC/RagA family TonB-linked outer membrane protein [Fibrella forsythiae]|uniref:SusC/RagA family TonB-linked outer membrane protein n=1 Tax=Fibrella forsythiae TaxID=2817061 RepID=A0ABS3JI86_9BACT|nr:SusC/RagA family TonB-linked outer membrane protein [Fibrella forsythiae]MBO0948959.1 SusC/RagA family TonB-linked outer membrane protein [Fibrella forsythiae]
MKKVNLYLIRGMKLTLIQLVLAILFTDASRATNADAQDLLNRRLTVQVRNENMRAALRTIERVADVKFSYSPQVVQSKRLVSLNAQNTTLKEVLDQLLIPIQVRYSVAGQQIILSRLSVSLAEPAPEQPENIPDAIVDRVISGTVTDEKGAVLPGVSVVIKGTTRGSVTDATGKYQLTIPDGPQILTFSFVGYVLQDVTVENQASIVVQLEADIKSLNEVVVVGYGTLDKKEVTSAITHVSGRDLLTIGATNPISALQGKVAGLTITNTGGGDPNSMPSIQLRGVSSRDAGLGPLVVINGVPGGVLENINQNDIESIDVLKGGAASAIYGTRGSNGVIMITTKKGTKGYQVDYNSYAAFDFATLQPKVLSADEFLAQKRGTDYGAKTDWLKAITRQAAFTYKHTLSFSGGDAKNNYRVTADYRNAEGIDLRANRGEYGARLSLNHTSPNNLYTIGVNVAPRYYTSSNADYGAYDQALTLNPTLPIRSLTDPTRYYQIQSGFTSPFNPVERLQTEQSGTEAKFLDYNASLKLNILPTLNTQVTWGQFTRDFFDFFFRPSTSTYAAQYEGGMNSASRAYNKNDQRSLEWVGNYSLDLQAHSLKVLAGYSYQYFVNSGLSADNRNFPSDALTYNNLGTGLYQQVEGRNGLATYKNDSKLIAFFGRVNYGYQDKYLFSASLRREGSSKFGFDNKWGNFPAVSAGWRISEEPFMKGRTWINELKLRADYGVTGNQDFGNYLSLDTYSGYGYYLLNGVQYQVWGPSQNTNYTLRWETAQNLNFGADFAFFNNKLSGSINYYTRKNTDLLGNYTVQLPPNIQGQTYANVGSMQNSGIELQLNATIVDKPNFKYNLSFAGATNSNKFVSFSNDAYKGQSYVDVVGLPAPGSPGTAQRLQEGQRIGTFYMLKSAGVGTDGKLQVYNKIGEIIPADKANNDDKQVVGNGLPQLTLSLNNSFSYKKWDATVFFRGSFGYKIFNTQAFYTGTPSTQSNANVLTSAYGSSKYALLTNQATTVILSDYFLENGSFLKLDNASIGYNPRVTSKVVRSVRVYAAAKNMVTFTSFTGGDPDRYPVNGLYPGINSSRSYYPTTTQVLVGIQLGL